MKLIKTFMATALLSTAFAGIAFAAEEPLKDEHAEPSAHSSRQASIHEEGEGNGEGQAEGHGAGLGGLEKETADAADVLELIGFTQDNGNWYAHFTAAGYQQLKELDANAFDEESAKDAINSAKATYAELIGAAGDESTFEAEADGANLKNTIGFELKAKTKGLGIPAETLRGFVDALGDPLKPYKKGGIADKLARLATADEGKNPLYAHYQNLLGAPKPKAKEAAADLKNLFEGLSTQGVNIAAPDATPQYISLDEYIIEETASLPKKAVDAHIAKLTDEHTRAINDLKTTHATQLQNAAKPEEKAGGAILNRLFAQADKVPALTGAKAFKGHKLTPAGSKKAGYDEAFANALVELSGKVTSLAQERDALKAQLGTIESSSSAPTQAVSGLRTTTVNSSFVGGTQHTKTAIDTEAPRHVAHNPYAGEAAS